jgi:hypothetical protein
LLEERRNYIICSGIAIIVGAVLFGFGHLADVQQNARTAKGPFCPLCNGELQGAPQLCMHCRSQLAWVNGEPMSPADAQELRRKQAEKRQQQAAFQQREEARKVAEIELQRESLANLRSDVANGICAAGRAILKLPSLLLQLAFAFDDSLKDFLGQENEILYRFAQVLLYLILPPVAVVTVALGMSML